MAPGLFHAPIRANIRPSHIEDSMPRVAQLAALLLACGTMLASAAPGERRIYKLDSVIANVKGRTLTIQAKGAVQTGGWRKPRLHMLHSPDAHTVEVELLALPPPPEMTVIQALVPIEATLHVRTRRHIVSVRAEAEANEVTAQVLR
jgi:hypothetical protein